MSPSSLGITSLSFCHSVQIEWSISHNTLVHVHLPSPSSFLLFFIPSFFPFLPLVIHSSMESSRIFSSFVDWRRRMEWIMSHSSSRSQIPHDLSRNSILDPLRGVRVLSTSFFSISTLLFLSNSRDSSLHSSLRSSVFFCPSYLQSVPTQIVQSTHLNDLFSLSFEAFQWSLMASFLSWLRPYSSNLLFSSHSCIIPPFDALQHLSSLLFLIPIILSSQLMNWLVSNSFSPLHRHFNLFSFSLFFFLPSLHSISVLVDIP